MDKENQNQEQQNLKPVGSARKRGKKLLGMQIPRHFTRADENPFDAVEWELRTANISNEKGDTVFEQVASQVCHRPPPHTHPTGTV